MAKLAAKTPLDPVDPDAKIPEAVKRAAAQSDALHKQLYQTPDAPAPAPVVEPVPAPIAVEPAPAPAPVVENWEHKFRSEQGRRIQLENRLTGLEATIAAMAAPVPVATASPPPTPLITDKDIADYGPEFIDVIRRASDERFTPIITELQGQVKNLTKHVTNFAGNTAQRDRDAMLAELGRVVPNWAVLNENIDFLNWLALPDTYSGAIRQNLLTAAFDENNTPRVLAFFQGFLAEEAATSPRTPALDPAPPAPPADPKVSLADLAAPGRAKSAAAPGVPAEKPIISRASVTKFYLDKSRGAYAGRETEALRLEQEIVAAGREGRIQ